jgi:opacity protein-like surface antigen
MKKIYIALAGAALTTATITPQSMAQTQGTQLQKPVVVDATPLYNQGTTQSQKPVIVNTNSVAPPETLPQAQTPKNEKPQSESGFYGAVSGDARIFNSTTIKPINVGADFNTGYGINGSVGYKFKNHLRVEGEVSYGSNDVKTIKLPGTPSVTTPGTPLTTASPITTPIPIPIPGVGIIPAGTTIPAGVTLTPGTPPTTASAITVGGLTIPAGTSIPAFGNIPTAGGTAATTLPGLAAVNAPASGGISTLSGLVNVYYDLPTGTAFEPYIGAGVGVANASANNVSATYPGTSAGTNLSGSSLALVYQLMAGVSYNVSPSTAVTLGYRYFNVGAQSFNSSGVGKVTAEGIGTNNVEMGVRMKF